MILLMLLLFLSTLPPFMITLKLVQQHLRCEYVTRLRGADEHPTSSIGPFPLTSSATICALGSIAPDFLADDDVRILDCEEPLSLATSTMFVAKGCPSIFIVFLGASNFNLPCSKPYEPTVGRPCTHSYHATWCCATCNTSYS